MRILLLSIGTRGDMEPFLAAGKILAEADHEVHAVMPEQFRELVADTGFPFYPLDRRFLELLSTEAGRGVMGQRGSRFRQIANLMSLARQSMATQKNLLAEQRAYVQKIRPDRILYHPKCIYGRVWAMQQPEKARVISPIPCWLHPVREYPHIAIGRSLGVRLNLWSYRLINSITALMTARWTRSFGADFPAVNISRRQVLRFMRHRENTLYTISPSIFPRPEYWPEQARITGYFERRKTDHWQPPVDLLHFIDSMNEQAAKITFITFGSMVNASPQATITTILEVLRTHDIPAIINVSSGGLPRVDEAPDRVFFVEDIPYEWIFPRVHSIVHHGGSGTTHTALKHGRPGFIVPHIIDQFFWNRRVTDLGAGPLGVPIKKLTAETFSSRLLEVRDNEHYAQRAAAIGRQMRTEAKPEDLVRLVVEEKWNDQDGDTG